MTTVSKNGRNWLIDGELVNKGRPDGEGQLFGYRWVQGIFDDHTPPAANTYAYEGRNNRQGNWERPRDPDRNVNELIAMLPTYRAKGIRGFTLSMQGGAVMRLSNDAGFEGGGDGITAWTPDGSLQPAWKARLIKLLDAADRNGIVVNLQCFYRRRLSVFANEGAMQKAMRTLADVICSKPYRNVLYEVCNEWEETYQGPGYLRPYSKLEAAIRDVRAYAMAQYGITLLFGCSQGGSFTPTAGNSGEFDYYALQSGLSASAGTMKSKIQAAKNAKNIPIIITEAVDAGPNWPKLTEAVGNQNVGWFLYDQGDTYPNAGGDYKSGYQSPPVNWSLTTAHKTAYLDRIAQYAGPQDAPDPDPDPEPEPGQAPATPTGVAVAAGTGGARVSWDAVTGAAYYSVQYREVSTEEPPPDPDPDPDPTHDGMFVFENDEAPANGWSAETKTAGYTGTNYYVTHGGCAGTAAKPSSDTANGVLNYTFDVPAKARYRVRLHRCRLGCTPDGANDIWVKMDGGAPIVDHNKVDGGDGNQKIQATAGWTKLILGSPDPTVWGWAGQMQPYGGSLENEQHRYQPIWELEAGRHTVRLGHRSNEMALNRIHVFDIAKWTQPEADSTQVPNTLRRPATAEQPWLVVSPNPTGTSTILTNLVADKTYEVRVAAGNEVGTSDYSASVNYTVPTSPPPEDDMHHAHEHDEPHKEHRHHHHPHGLHPHKKGDDHHHVVSTEEPPPPPPPPPSSEYGPRLPRPAEPQGVVVNPDNLVSQSANSPEGTQFILSAGVYRVKSFKPKNRQKFWGRDGAVFDGGMRGLQEEMKTASDGCIDAKAGGTSPVGVEIRYIEVRNYLGTGIRPWIGWKVLDCWVHDVAGTGIGSGLEANHCQGAEIAYCEVWRCGHTETTGHDAGGIKLARTGPSNYNLDKKCDWNNGRPQDTGFHVHHNYVHHNSGNGIWWDVSAGGDRVDHNRCEYNQRKGIFFEISPGAFWCDHNVSKHNGWERAAADYGIGCKGCKDTTIRDNEVDDNGHEANLNDSQSTYFVIDPDTFHNNGTGAGWVVCKSAQRSPGSGWRDAGGGRAYVVEQTGFSSWAAARDWVGANRTPWKYLKQGILCQGDDRVPIAGCNSNGNEARNDFIDNKLNGDNIDIESGGGARTVSGNAP